MSDTSYDLKMFPCLNFCISQRSKQNIIWITKWFFPPRSFLGAGSHRMHKPSTFGLCARKINLERIAFWSVYYNPIPAPATQPLYLCTSREPICLMENVIIQEWCTKAHDSVFPFFITRTLVLHTYASFGETQSCVMDPKVKTDIIITLWNSELNKFVL